MGDLLDAFMRVDAALWILAEGKGNYRKRLEAATEALVLAHDTAPEHIRARISNILAVRRAQRQQVGSYVWFAMDRVRGNARRKLISDIMIVYSEVLCELTRNEAGLFGSPEDLIAERHQGRQGRMPHYRRRRPAEPRDP